MNLNICEKCAGHCIKKIDLQYNTNILMATIFFINDIGCHINIKKDKIYWPWKRKYDRSILYSSHNIKKTFFKKGRHLADKYFKKISIEDVGLYFTFYGANHSKCPYVLEHNLSDWNIK